MLVQSSFAKIIHAAEIIKLLIKTTVNL